MMPITASANIHGAKVIVGIGAFGFVTGYGVFLLMRGIDDYSVEVLLTLAPYARLALRPAKP